MNNRFVLLALLFLLSTPLYAADVWLSSNTTTSDALKTLCGGGKRGILHGVCINTTQGAGTTFKVWNSSFTGTGVPAFGSRLGANGGCFYYDVSAPKGLVYTSDMNAGDVTVLYACN